jgi:ABC-type amino acid transport system permease subunit
MSPVLAFRRIIMPQAFRIALPPMTNDFVSLFKDTSVAFAISVWELATAYRELANASGQFSATRCGCLAVLSGDEFADGPRCAATRTTFARALYGAG